MAEEAGESWEDKADMSSAATTPDDEDNSMEDDSGETCTKTVPLYHHSITCVPPPCAYLWL